MKQGVKMKKLVAVVVPFLMLAGSTWACDIHGETGIVEENSLNIPVGRKSLNGMTEAVFLEQIEKVSKFYKSVVEQRGATLKVRKLWDDGTVNAYAKQVKPGEMDSDDQRNDSDKTIFEVNMFGGLARHETITPDGFALVVCHELGHHLAGAPRKLDWMGNLRWASNEGQADYWGTMKCLRKVLENEAETTTFLKKQAYDKEAYDACRDSYGTDEKEVALCTRTSMAGKSLAMLFNSLRSIATPVKFDTPDSKVAAKTFHSHPQPQCRLDTYFQGSLCTISHTVDVDHDNPFLGVCTRRDGDSKGIRPLCWWNPSEYDNDNKSDEETPKSE